MDKNNEIALQKIIEFHCPRYSELPQVFLYKDQVITYIEKCLTNINVNKEEKLLTPTMLNSYVKQKIVSPPKDRKYNEKHLAYLIVVCILKQVFTLNEICRLIRIHIDKYEIDQAYDYFCIELEKCLKAVFQTRDFSGEGISANSTNESLLLKSVVMSFCNKLCVQMYLKEIEEK